MSHSTSKKRSLPSSSSSSSDSSDETSAHNERQTKKPRKDSEDPLNDPLMDLLKDKVAVLLCIPAGADLDDYTEVQLPTCICTQMSETKYAALKETLDVVNDDGEKHRRGAFLISTDSIFWIKRYHIHRVVHYNEDPDAFMALAGFYPVHMRPVIHVNL